MNLPKAKEIIDLNIKEAGKKMPPDVRKALTLGSQALSSIIAWRQDNDDDLLWDFLSETED